MPTPLSHHGRDPKRTAPLRVVGPSAHAGALSLCLEGEFDLAGVSVFEEALRAKGGATRVIIDLRELDFIDSSGIATLLRASHRLREAGGGLQCIVAAEGMVRKVIEMTHVADVFDVREEPPD
jgi:anti-anti-sigma factor